MPQTRKAAPRSAPKPVTPANPKPDEGDGADNPPAQSPELVAALARADAAETALADNERARDSASPAHVSDDPSLRDDWEDEDSAPMDEGEQSHPYYCPGCGRRWNFPTECRGLTDATPHAPMEVVSTDELNGEPEDKKSDAYRDWVDGLTPAPDTTV